MSTPNLTLWRIEESIIGLQEIIESPDTSEDEKQTAFSEMAAWVQREVEKVDGVRAWLRHCAVMEDAAKFEAAAMNARAKRWAERARRIKDICLTFMEIRGLKRLEGQSGVLRMHGNGGYQPLKIARPDLVPDEYRVYALKIAAHDWKQLQRILLLADAGDLLRKMLAGVVEALDEAKIRSALVLKENVPGAELEERGHHLRCE